MAKIKKITGQNLRQIEILELDLNGCSVVVTGGNNKGKSTILRGLISRLQGNSTNIKSENTDEDGIYNMYLTDGCLIKWELTNKGEKLTFIDAEGNVIKKSLITYLQDRYFNGEKKRFDIDTFLTLTPKLQTVELLRVLGIDIKEVDDRYKVAYDNRAEANKKFNEHAAAVKTKPIAVDKPNIDELKAKRSEIQTKIDNKIAAIHAKNNDNLDNWRIENEKLKKEVDDFNLIQDKKSIEKLNYSKELDIVKNLEFLINCFDFNKAAEIIDKLPNPLLSKIFTETEKPELLPIDVDKSELLEIEAKIEKANEDNIAYSLYNERLSEYNKWVETGKDLRAKATDCDKKVKEIEAEKKELIESAKLPEGITFKDNELLYNGFQLNRDNQSSSALYIAGLKLATINIGELEAVHFDASFLDNRSLAEVEAYANSIGLQLLIERPDYEGKEIEYQLLINK